MTFKSFSTISKPLTLSPEEIMAWEERDTQKRKIEVMHFEGRSPEEKHTFCVIKPSYNAIITIAEQTKKGIHEGNYKLLELCILAGPMAELDTDDGLALGLLQEVSELMESKKKI